MENEEISNIIKELIEKAEVTVNSISISQRDGKDKGKTTWFSVDVKEPQFFLSRDAEALFALNHITRKIIENKKQDKKSETTKNIHEGEIIDILIDINDFQKKRIESIHAVAYMMAERARYFKSRIEIDPMPAFERRIVHEFLSDAPDLKTESEGEGSSRRVVIKYIG